MKPLLVSIALLLSQFAAHAQSVIAAAGNYFEADDLSVSWTLGEVLTETLTHPEIVLSQGQQQFTVTLISGISEEHDFKVTAYPNPTKSAISVSLSDEHNRNLVFTLFNSLGVAVRQHVVPSNQENSISMVDLPAGVYIVTIKDNQELIKTFRIIKQ